MKLNLIQKFLLIVNILLLLIQLQILNFFETFINIDLLNFVFSYIIFINFLFFLFWVINIKWPFILFIPFFIFLNHFDLLYQFPQTAIRTEANSFKVMSFNVRLFNKYDWIKNENIPKKISNFLKNEDPDIISFQEFSIPDSPEFKNYKYSYIKKTKEKGTVGLAILSKFPIINTGFIKFDDSNNSGVFSDIIIKNDTVRLYNLHLESLRIDLYENKIDNSLSYDSKNRFQLTFEKQLKQSNIFQKIDTNNNFKSIICVDLNNSAFSKVYNKIKGDKIDAFVAKGSGLGSTFNFFIFPFRIDYIFFDKRFKIYDFLTHKNESLSDHKPISVKLNY